MTEHSTGRKGALLPIYVGGASGRHAPRKKAPGKRSTRMLHTEDLPLSSSSASSKKPPVPLPVGRTWNMLWALFIVAFVVCMVCLVTLGRLVQTGSISNNEVQGGDRSKQGLFSVWKETQVVEKLKQLSHMFTAVDESKVKTQQTRQALQDLGDYECLGWRQTTNCTPHGDREWNNDKNCSALVPYGVSGYCEVRHQRTGEVTQVLKMHCTSLRPGVKFTCNMFQSLLTYSILSTDYEHDPNFSYTRNQEVFRTTNQLSNTPIPIGDDGVKNEDVGHLELSYDRGIVVVVYEKLLLGAYVSVRSLRALGCTLPIEMWYKTSEMDGNHPLVRLMVEGLGVYLRVIDDPRATTFYTKLYALYYSAFDQVLLLDADNFAVRDPSYLFDTPEFINTGAIFWPDYWRPGNTIFNIHANSFVWEFFGLEYADVFEQESGQVMINRRTHLKALNVLMYYGFSMPRAFEHMRLVWGDKDLFRFAWLKTKSSFYMSSRPPGSAGTKHTEYDLFCGVTMVQHDPMGEILFLHRNTEKLTYANNRILWTHIQQYKRALPVANYYVRGANGGKVFPQFKRCFGKDVHYEKLFTLKPMSAFHFENLENDLLRFAAAGAEVLQLSGYRTEASPVEADLKIKQG
uniref:RxLR effector candidate protein n=1 Tax=Hyaloperonospora arabidopsidis (strain Emoy2) TaxID=559515 RepID=M4BVB4_HYAAE